MNIELSPNAILSIDWDYVTGDCAFYYHHHCGFCQASSGINNRGNKNKLDVIWQEKQDRLLKLNLYKDTPIFVAECHANIMDIIEYFNKIPQVFDYDSHCDNYDSSPVLHCGNWIYHLEKLIGKPLVMSRPRTIGKVGAIFICHSSPWTPRCMDEEFFKFINMIAEKTQADPRFIGHRKVSLRNGYRRTNG